MKQSEEDIKIKVVRDYLFSLGFEKDELQFEKSFSVHLGRFTARVDTEQQIKTAQPRLDILVKRNEKNLFVIEVKTDSHEL